MSVRLRRGLCPYLGPGLPAKTRPPRSRKSSSTCAVERESGGSALSPLRQFCAREKEREREDHPHRRLMTHIPKKDIVLHALPDTEKRKGAAQ